jgi:hypothetical protein
MKIGVISESNLNANYRVFIPMHALRQRGHEIVWPTPEGRDAPMRELLRCDLVHCYRRLDRLDDLRKLSERGVAVSFDNDDHHGAAEVSDGGRGVEGIRHNRLIFREILKAARLADVTSTPSEALADYYRSAGVDYVVVLENHLPRDMFGFASKSTREGIVVGWVAGREHRIDLERVPIAPALKRLLEAHPELRVFTIGVRLPLHSPRYEALTGVPFRDLLTATGRMDIGIAPLADTIFNGYRSNVKLKEYASGNAAWLASPVGPYRGFGEKQGGMLVNDGDWFSALDGLIRDARRRKRLTKRGLRWAKTETIDRHILAWEAAFLQALDRAQARMASRGVTAAR